MKYGSRALLAVVTVVFGCSSPPVEWIDYGSDFANDSAFQAASAAAVAPNDRHAELAKGVGDWVVEGKMYGAPGAPPITTTATASVDSILGGRVIRQTFLSEFMGQPFEGLLLMGHDNLTGEYWSVWIDSFSTWPLIDRGTGDDEGNLDLVGSMKDARAPRGRPSRTTIRHADDGSYVQRMYDTTPEGQEYLNMELVYRRA